MTDVELILSHTNDGLDVFEKYFEGTGHGLFKNTYREDTHPSCKLYYKNGRYVMKDYGSSEWSGDCFIAVARIFKLNPSTQFNDILHTIDKELSLFVLDHEHHVQNTFHPIKREVHLSVDNSLSFTAKYKSFSNEELAFWKQYGITQNILDRYNVRSIKECILSSREKTYTLYGTKESPAYGYLFNEGKGIKLYRPKASTRFLYGGYVSHPYVFGLAQLQDKDKVVFITGGEKDVMSLAAHGFSAVSFNSETSSIPEKIVSDLSTRFTSVILMYDCDETGKRESVLRHSQLRQTLDNVHNLVLPLSGTKEEKDISDYFATGHTERDLQQLVEQNINITESCMIQQDRPSAGITFRR